MNYPRALAVAVAATGAGAVMFLSSGSAPADAPVFEPLPSVGQPVSLPPVVTEAPVVVPAAELTAPAPKVAVAPKPQPVPVRKQAAPAPARKVAPAPKRVAVQSAPVQQQPQPAGTEPNGTGGWQLPACTNDSCVAAPSTEANQSAPCELVVIDLLGGKP